MISLAHYRLIFMGCVPSSGGSAPDWQLDIISGGAVSSLLLVMSGTMPDRINNLRIGEVIILAKDLQVLYNVDMICPRDKGVEILGASKLSRA